MWRLIYSIPLWILMFVIKTSLIILGWILVPIAVYRKAYKAELSTNTYGATRIIKQFTDKWMWLWSNWEDGICEGFQYKTFDKEWKQIIWWSCLRNPVNNLRLVPVLSCMIDPSKIKSIGTYDKDPVPHLYFCWHGMYSCLSWQFIALGKLRRLWIGFKLYPTDVQGLGQSHRARGAVFTTELTYKALK